MHFSAKSGIGIASRLSVCLSEYLNPRENVQIFLRYYVIESRNLDN